MALRRRLRRAGGATVVSLWLSVSVLAQPATETFTLGDVVDGLDSAVEVARFGAADKTEREQALAQSLASTLALIRGTGLLDLTLDQFSGLEARSSWGPRSDSRTASMPGAAQPRASTIARATS